MVLLAGGAVLVMQAFATAWEATTRAEERSAAVLFAMSKLADLELAHQQGHDLTARARGTFRVGTQPFAWDVAVRPVVQEDAREHQLVTLSITWSRGRSHDGSEFTMLLAPLPKDEKSQQNT